MENKLLIITLQILSGTVNVDRCARTCPLCTVLYNYCAIFVANGAAPETVIAVPLASLEVAATSIDLPAHYDTCER